MFRDGETGGTQAHFGERVGRRSDDGPAVFGNGVEQLQSAGECGYVVEVLDFTALDFAVLCEMIGVGEKLTNGGNARAAVSFVDDFCGVEATLDGPLRPDARHGGRGVDKDA